MRNLQNHGFTLLELIIVITIIGIISAITFAFIGPTRGKGADAGVKSNLVNARSQAEFYYNGASTSTESYIGLCNDRRNGVLRQVQSAVRAINREPRALYTNGDTTDGTMEVCRADASRFVVWVPLSGSTPTNPSGWCIDSANASRQVSQVLSAGQYECP